jgi:glycosyltransferase involved in cell wall biosynthesis
MSTAPVSVIILTWNRRSLLAKSVESALNQDFAPLEILVIDDGSDDGTAELVSQLNHPAIRYFPLHRSGHISKLRNFGIAHSRGEFFAFLDSDDLWKPNMLEALFAALNSHPEAGFGYSGYETFDDAGNTKIQLYRTGDDAEVSVQNIYARLLEGSMGPYPSAVVVRKSIIARTGLLDENLTLGEYEFFCRLALDFPAVIVHQPLVRIRKHSGNISHHLKAEELSEAILAVEKSYRARNIPLDVFRDRILDYRSALARVHLNAGDSEKAREQLLGCLSTIAIGRSA